MESIHDGIAIPNIAQLDIVEEPAGDVAIETSSDIVPLNSIVQQGGMAPAKKRIKEMAGLLN